jgi:hypothetical protein
MRFALPLAAVVGLAGGAPAAVAAQRFAMDK